MQIGKINDNLAAQIRLLTAAWFKTYDIFGGKRPKDWQRISLDSIANFIGGYSYSSAELQQSKTAMATIKNFVRPHGFKIDGFKEITPLPKLKETQYAGKFDILVAQTDVTQKAEIIGNVEPILTTAGYNTLIFSMDLIKVVPKVKLISKFMLAALLQDAQFKSHCLGYVNGTTVLHLNKKALPEYTFYFPKDINILSQLDNAFQYLYIMRSNLIEENRILQMTRDQILPKLMSGELDFSEIDI